MQARSHQDFLALLAEVDAVLAETTQPGAAYLLYTVGGFVMGRGSESRVTQDIDVATTIPDPVSAAAIKVAAQHGMNPAWLNDQVAEMIQATVPVDRFAEICRGRHLVVYGADDDLMLALKLMSGRDRDISDIVDLALRTRRTAPDDLLDAWDRVYGDVPHVAPQRHFVNSVICDDVMPALRRRGTAPGDEPSTEQASESPSWPSGSPAAFTAASSREGSTPRDVVMCGQSLGGKRVCNRKLRDAPCPHHPNSPGSRQVASVIR